MYEALGEEDKAATTTKTIAITKTCNGFGMEITDDASVAALTDDTARSAGVAVGWIIVGVTLEGVHWPTESKRTKIVELLSTVAVSETVVFTFEVQA